MKWEEMSNRERDALVAEKVMGWSEHYTSWNRGGSAPMVPMSLWKPSTNISDAWQVVEKMKGEKLMFTMCHVLNRKGEIAHYSVSFFDYDGAGKDFDSYSDSAPMAICLAALKAKGVEV